jgi:hypothetical protein
MRAIDLRIREETLAQAQELCSQRGLERAALLREAIEVGLLVLAASGPPADELPERYGALSGVRLAQLVRPRIAPVLDFLSRYGATPAFVTTANSSALAVHATDTAPAELTVDDAIHAALANFGVGALGYD